MNEQLAKFIENYKDGIPVRVDGNTVLMLSVATVVTVTVCALIVKYVKKM